MTDTGQTPLIVLGSVGRRCPSFNGYGIAQVWAVPKVLFNPSTADYDGQRPLDTHHSHTKPSISYKQWLVDATETPVITTQESPAHTTSTRPQEYSNRTDDDVTAGMNGVGFRREMDAGYVCGERRKLTSRGEAALFCTLSIYFCISGLLRLIFTVRLHTRPLRASHNTENFPDGAHAELAAKRKWRHPMSFPSIFRKDRSEELKLIIRTARSDVTTMVRSLSRESRSVT